MALTNNGYGTKVAQCKDLYVADRLTQANEDCGAIRAN